MTRMTCGCGSGTYDDDDDDDDDDMMMLLMFMVVKVSCGFSDAHCAPHGEIQSDFGG